MLDLKVEFAGGVPGGGVKRSTRRVKLAPIDGGQRNGQARENGRRAEGRRRGDESPKRRAPADIAKGTIRRRGAAAAAISPYAAAVDTSPRGRGGTTKLPKLTQRRGELPAVNAGRPPR